MMLLALSPFLVGRDDKGLDQGLERSFDITFPPGIQFLVLVRKNISDPSSVKRMSKIVKILKQGKQKE